jgi:hypothetical protein
MASTSLPDCIFKQNTFLHLYRFLAVFYPSFAVIPSHPLFAMRGRGWIAAVITKSIHRVLKNRAGE